MSESASQAMKNEEPSGQARASSSGGGFMGRVRRLSSAFTGGGAPAPGGEGGEEAEGSEGGERRHRKSSVSGLYSLGKALITGQADGGNSTESPASPMYVRKEGRVRDPLASSVGDDEVEIDRPKDTGKWLDPDFNPKGKDPRELKDFNEPEGWWTSAEQALEMLENERLGLKAQLKDRANPFSQALLGTNRYVMQRLKKVLADDTEKPKKFRDGVEPIAHVLEPDMQKQMHAMLCKACRKGDIEQVESLLRFQIDLDYADAFGTPLHYAAAFLELEIARMLLNKGAYPGALDARDQTPLHTATSKDAPSIVELLLRYGAPANSVDLGGLTALHIASQHGFVKCADYLITGGADCDRQNRIGWTPLHLAVMGMHHNLMEKLCIAGMANPMLRCSKTTEVAVTIGIDRSVKFEAVKGDTPAHFAARQGHYMCLKVCLDHGGLQEAVNEYGDTVMHSAVENADPRVVELILEYGWNSLEVDNLEGKDALEVADDVLKSHQKDVREDAKVRTNISTIKTALQKMGIRKNQVRHRELIEAARRGIGGRKKQKKDATPAFEEEDDLPKIEVDEKTLEEKMEAMALELEAARAEARNAEMQSRLKTHELNEVLVENKRRLAEAEFMLERERASRLNLEKELLDLLSVDSGIGTADQGEFGDEFGASAFSEADVLRLPSRGHTAGSHRRVKFQ